MDLNEMLKEAQKLQKDMENITKQLETEEVMVSNGAKTIRIWVTGSGKFQKLEIDDGFLKGDPRGVEKEILSTFQQAVESARKKHEEAMRQITENLSLPRFDEMQAQVKGPTRRTPSESDSTFDRRV